MAKKKTESAPGSTPAKKSPAAGKQAAGAGDQSSSKASASRKKPSVAAAPSIDTSLAANAAAAMIASKAAQSSAAEQAQPKKESAAFKQLKAGLNKPAGAPLGGAFAVPKSTRKSAVPFAGGKQVGHNQTFGADVNRSGVPRRTPG